MGKTQKEEKWNFTERQMEDGKVTSELLLKRHQCKRFLYQIVADVEKWIHFENLKGNKSRLDLPNQH